MQVLNGAIVIILVKWNQRPKFNPEQGCLHFTKHLYF